MLITSELNLSGPVTQHVSSLHLQLHGMSHFFFIFINEIYFVNFSLNCLLGGNIEKMNGVC